MNTLRSPLYEPVTDRAINHRLDQLRLPYIPMSGLTYDDSIIIYSTGQANGKTRLSAGFDPTDRSLRIQRDDSEPLQMYDGSLGVRDEARYGLVEPIDHLQLVRDEHGWLAEVDPQHIRRATFMGFLSVMSYYAEIRQQEIESGKISLSLAPPARAS